MLCMLTYFNCRYDWVTAAQVAYQLTINLPVNCEKLYSIKVYLLTALFKLTKLSNLHILQCLALRPRKKVFVSFKDPKKIG